MSKIDKVNVARSRVELEWFSSEMRKKLIANSHKQNWLDCEYRYLVGRMCDEASELLEALFAAQHEGIGEQGFENVIEECADVANFVMMIADKARNKHTS